MEVKKSKISIVVPCYNEEQAIPFFCEEIKKIETQMTECEFEYVFVDDGSKDNTLTTIKSLAEQNSNVEFISFSRNFGKESAIYAGLKTATGDYVAIMDVDLQDPPSLLPEMYNSIINEGYDIVATRRVTRKGEPPIRSFFARKFYKLMKKISDVELTDGARDFRLMKRVCVNALLEMKEYNRFSKGLFGWIGFKTKWLEYENIERVAGTTKWSFWKLFKYSLEGITAFSVMPLYIALFIGMLMGFGGFVGMVAVAVVNLVENAYVLSSGFILSTIFFVGGLILTAIGILGFYHAKTYLEIKNRPIYIVREETQNKDNLQDGNI